MSTPKSLCLLYPKYFTADCNPGPLFSCTFSPSLRGWISHKSLLCLLLCCRHSQGGCHGVCSSWLFTNLRYPCHNIPAQPLSPCAQTPCRMEQWGHLKALNDWAVYCAVQIHKPNRERQRNSSGGQGFSLHHKEVNTHIG